MLTFVQRQRVLPALAVTLVTLALCYIYAEMYEPSPRDQRMWPNVPPAAATVIALIGTNLLIFTLWKAWPPAWRMLNRYFISVPVYPYAISVVGNIFSHQQFRHLTWNMVLLWFIGTRREFILPFACTCHCPQQYTMVSMNMHEAYRN
jgi:rhomboid-like protein